MLGSVGCCVNAMASWEGTPAHWCLLLKRVNEYSEATLSESFQSYKSTELLKFRLSEITQDSKNVEMKEDVFRLKAAGYMSAKGSPQAIYSSSSNLEGTYNSLSRFLCISSPVWDAV